MPDKEKIQIPPMRPEERGIAALSHLSTLVPLWALVANAVLYFLYRESSRAVCFHARQRHQLPVVVSGLRHSPHFPLSPVAPGGSSSASGLSVENRRLFGDLAHRRRRHRRVGRRLRALLPHRGRADFLRGRVLVYPGGKTRVPPVRAGPASKTPLLKDKPVRNRGFCVDFGNK